MKSVKKMLKEEAKSVLPSGEVKQNILREMGWEEPQREYALAGGGTRARAGKKLTVGLIAAFLALAVTLCVLLPVFLRGNGPVSDTLNKFDKITDADSFYAYGALSAGTLLSSRTDGAAAVSLPDAVSAKALNTARSSEEDTLTSLNRYMSLVESLLGEEDITETAVAPAQGYAFGMEVHGGSLLGGGRDAVRHPGRRTRGPSAGAAGPGGSTVAVSERLRPKGDHGPGRPGREPGGGICPARFAAVGEKAAEAAVGELYLVPRRGSDRAYLVAGAPREKKREKNEKSC